MTQPPLPFTLLSCFGVATPSHTAQQELLHAYRKGWNWQMNIETFLTQKLQRGLVWETGRRLGEEADPQLATSFFQAAVEHNKVSPESPAD